MKPVAVFAAALLLVGLASGCQRSDRAAARATPEHPQSPGAASTANLPPTPNNAGTGSNSSNTPYAVYGGQLPDWSNPRPSGIPPASAAARD